MNYELSEYLSKGCLVYMDDSVIYVKTVKNHNIMLIKVLNKLKENDLKINVEKIQLRKIK